MLQIAGHARKHLVSDAAIRHSFVNAVETVWYEHEDGSVRWIALGSDLEGNMLESVWVELGHGSFLAIHCQPVRKATIRLIKRIKKEGKA